MHEEPDAVGAHSPGQDSPHHDPVSDSLYNISAEATPGDLFDRSGLTADDVAQVRQVMKALAELRDAELEVMKASERYMKLSAADMRALHYLIAAKRVGQVVTPSLIAAHLNISPASTTKLLNRLEKSGDVMRRLHPEDRRALAIEIAPATEALAKQTIGKQHAQRAQAAARLSSSEREIVIRFLREMARDISISHADWAQSGSRDTAASSA